MSITLGGELLPERRVGFPLSSADVRRAAFQYATGIGVSAKFGKNAKVNETVGKDWFHSFMARHPTLSLRTSETLSYGRGCGLNRVIVSDFYEVLRKAVTEHHIAPQNMYNMDESGVQMTTRKGAVVAARGSKRVPQLATGEKGETVSLIACCSATGVFFAAIPYFQRCTRKARIWRWSASWIQICNDTVWICTK